MATERFLNYLSIQVAAMSMAVFVLVKSITPNFGNVVLKINNSLRKDLFGVYLIHALWLPIVNNGLCHCCSEIVTMPLVTIIVFILSLLTTKLIRLIPYLRKVVE